MRVEDVGKGYKKENEKACNDLRGSRVIVVTVDELLCGQRIACRFSGNRVFGL